MVYLIYLYDSHPVIYKNQLVSIGCSYTYRLIGCLSRLRRCSTTLCSKTTCKYGIRHRNIKAIFSSFHHFASVATVGYGNYYPVTAVGRLIAVFTMLSGIGIFVVLVSTLAQRRLTRTESKFKSRTEFQQNLLGHGSKEAGKTKIGVIGSLSEEDFNDLIITMKSLRHTLGEESNLKCSRCDTSYYDKPKFCSNCGLDLRL
jgi:hypothetical protein